MNELRALVGLLKPRDLFPCVEDPEKLTYLDLKGCFGDLCDLTDCTYLKQVGAISSVKADVALENMLAERWAYDDIEEAEHEEEDAETSSVVELDRESKRHANFQSNAIEFVDTNVEKMYQRELSSIEDE